MPLVTSDYVLDETYTRLRCDAGLQIASAAKEVIDEAQRLNLLHVEWVNERIAEESWKLFIKYQDQKISFTDCTSWSICKRLGIKRPSLSISILADGDGNLLYSLIKMAKAREFTRGLFGFKWEFQVRADFFREEYV